MSTLAGAAQSVRDALHDAGEGLIERKALLQLIALAAVAREHVLIIGPPGTAKSEAVRRVSRALGGRSFEYLLGRFTEPSEIFGPVDLQKLREGVVETRTEGMLPEAELAFLDEVFLGSTAILNTLLGLLNERVFRRGSSVIRCPLRVCVGASNALPQEEALAAFADRFLVHTFVEALPDTRLEDLLEAGWTLESEARAPRVASVADLDVLAKAARTMDLAAVRPLLADALRTLRGAGISLSDRRVVKIQRLVAAAAALDGREVASSADLWPLVYAVPDPDSQALARKVLRELLEQSASDVLSDAAEEASQGPAARARRILDAGQELLDQPAPDSDEARRSWRLRLEGVAREIDASFAAADRPPEVTELRSRIVELTRA